jgi:hypothetical protein
MPDVGRGKRREDAPFPTPLAFVIRYGLPLVAFLVFSVALSHALGMAGLISFY